MRPSKERLEQIREAFKFSPDLVENELLAEIDALIERNAKLEKVFEAAKVLRQAQIAYMANRGNQELGKAVAVAARKVDETFKGL